MASVAIWRIGAIAAAWTAAVAPVVSAHGTSITPVQKVVAMLEDMSAKAKSDKHAEEVTYAEFSTWCGSHTAALKSQISSGSMEMERLSAAEGKHSEDAKTLGAEVAQHEADIAKYTAEISERTKQRESGHKAFVAEQNDYAESIDALERAINTLSKQNYDRTSMLQVANAQQLPSEAQQMLTAFMDTMGEDDAAEDPGFLTRAAPQANAYEFQSTSIIDLLKKLKGEFIDKKSECEKEEMSAKHAHDMVIQDLTSASEVATSASGEKSQLAATKAKDAALAKRQLSAVTLTKESDSKTLSDVTAECAEKKESFAEKQKLRAEELVALDKAIQILSSEEVQVNGAKHLSLSQLRTGGTILIQDLGGGRGRGAAEAQGIRRKISEFLARRGRELKSDMLGLLAQKMATDPFAKVKKLIEDLITRLHEEAHSDAEHEGFCDKEVGQSKLTREKLTADIDGLSAEIENTKATISMLTNQIAELEQALAELETSVREATEQRSAEKTKNAATVKDSEDAAKAVSAAVAVLKEFYSKASSATALLQAGAPVNMGSEEWNAMGDPKLHGTVDKGHKEGMQTYGATYTGQQEEAGGVLAMLEVIASDFATLKADTESSEAMAAKSHETFLRASSEDKAVKSRQAKMSADDKIDAESKLHSDTEDLKLTQDKLLAAERYYAKLAPQCNDQGMTFDERAGARKAEIESLKEALRILEGEDISL